MVNFNIGDLVLFKPTKKGKEKAGVLVKISSEIFGDDAVATVMFSGDSNKETLLLSNLRKANC